MLEALRRGLALLTKRRRAAIFLMVPLAVLVSGVEVVAAGLVYLLLTVLTEASIADLPWPLKPVLGVLPSNQQGQVLAIAIATFALLRSGLIVFQSYAQQRIANGAGLDLSLTLVRQYLRQDYEWHLRRDTAELIRNATISTQIVANQVILPIVRLASEALVVVVLLCALLLIAPGATVAATLVLGPALYFLLRVVHPSLNRHGRELQETSAQSYKYLQEGLDGIRDVKLLSLSDRLLTLFRATRHRLARASYLNATLSEVPRALIEFSLIFFIVVFYLWRTWVQDDTGASALSALGAFAYVGLRLQPSIQRIASAVTNLRTAAAAIDDVDRDLRLPVASHNVSNEPRHADIAPQVQDLTVTSVSFRFAESSTPVISGATVCLRAGSTLGICGTTGGGKTTLINLMLGILQPTSGTVAYGGEFVHDDLPRFHAVVSLVSQDIFLFDDTIEQNIVFGARLGERDVEWLNEVISLCQLEDVVTALPDGLQTIVGPRGRRLSGGQRQRLAIARALYRRPHILFLDEGTSALDTKTEERIIRSLSAFSEPMSIVMVAHRLSTLASCDEVVVVENGAISDRGSYEDMRSSHSLFRNLG